METRMCGTCLEEKPVSDFYKDGTNSDGDIRYRRDCKDCYRKSRAMAKRAKAPRRTRTKVNARIVK